jgi:lipoic acid synthetase
MRKNPSLPKWLRQKLPTKKCFNTKELIKKYNVNTVCEEAKCPNRFICFKKSTATFLALGKECTRNCKFCNIAFSKNPPPPDEKEAIKIASFAKKLNLKHIVITMVTRDDLKDGGANHMAFIIRTLKKKLPTSSLEVLTSDFFGNTALLEKILKENIKIFNHNIETTRSLTPKIRDKSASYERSLKMLKYAKNNFPTILVKSGFMVGLGESKKEVKDTIKNLKEVGCDIITIGQYLQPSKKNIKVKKFIKPHDFKEYEKYGNSIGVKKMICSPFVRSSLNIS